MKFRKFGLMIVIAGFVFLLTNCFFPGTGWLHIYNDLGTEYAITQLYVFELEPDTNVGEDLLEDENPSFLNDGEYITEYNLSPGVYSIQGQGHQFITGLGFVEFTFSKTANIEADEQNTAFISVTDLD